MSAGARAGEVRGVVVPLEYPPTSIPRPRYGHGSPPHSAIEDYLRGHSAQFLQLLLRLREYAAALAAIAIANPAEGEPHWEQTWFTGLDGISLYGMLRELAPAVYLEVGSGHSTRFAARAIRDGALATRV